MTGKHCRTAKRHYRKAKKDEKVKEGCWKIWTRGENNKGKDTGRAVMAFIHFNKGFCKCPSCLTDQEYQRS